MSHRTSFFSIAAAFVVFGLVCGPANAAPEQNRLSSKIDVMSGIEADFPPYSMVDAKGQPSGYAVDLIRAVARTADLQIKFPIDSWEHLRKKLEKGEIDVIPIMAKSPERAKKVDFSDTHTYAYDAVFVRSGQNLIHSLADLRGKRILVEAGDLSEDYLRASKFPAEIVPAVSITEAMNLLRAGRGDAVICSQVVGLVALNEAHIVDVVLAQEPLVGGYEREFAFAVRKSDRELLNRLNEGLKAVIASGEYQKIYHKWFANLDPELQRREKGRSQLLLILLISVLTALICAALVMVFKREVNRKTRSLAENEQRFRGLVENLPGLVFRCSNQMEARTGRSSWKMLYMSDATERISGYPAEEFMSGARSVTSVIHPDDLASYQKLRAHVIANAERFSFDFRIVTRDGQVRWLHARGSSTVDASNAEFRVMHLDGIILDSTEQKRVSDLLTQQQSKLASSARLSALGEMAGGIAHEINNPLAIINLRIHQLTQLASKGDVKAATVIDIASRVEATAIRISKIVKSLHTVARESEHDPFELVKVKTVFNDVFELCFERMRKHGIEVFVENVGENLKLECKRVQISQVLINLLNNAFDAVVNEPVRWIRLTARETVENGRTAIEFSLSDSGVGISHEQAQKIFQPFFTTKGIGKGTGLGLSISKGIIEAHDGSIWLDSESKETRFVFILPKYQRKNSKRTTPRSVAQQPNQTVEI